MTYLHAWCTVAAMGVLACEPCGAAATEAGGCRAVSDATTTPLVELYTSEGCDSCPPADRWLTANFPRISAPGGALALAFHVDYWDRLGWVDRFGAPAWTERQRDAMRANRATFVYTPQILLQGHEFSAARRAMPRSALERIAREPAGATIELTAMAEGTGISATASGRVADPALREHASVSIAYVDSGLVSDVKTGENRGVRLSHDHVVRALKSAPAAGNPFNHTARFSRPSEAGVAPTLVAFVQNTANGDVLQTLALPLADCHP